MPRRRTTQRIAVSNSMTSAASLDAIHKELAMKQRKLCCNGNALIAIQKATTVAAQLSSSNRSALIARLRALTGGQEAEGALCRIESFLRVEVPVVIHFHPWQNDRRSNMCRDSHYRNQFETKLTKGW